MVDIAKCNNTNCKICQSCFRYRATPAEYQAYVLVDKPVNTSEDCGEYWPFDDEEELAALEELWAD